MITEVAMMMITEGAMPFLKGCLVLTPRIIGTGEDPVKRIIILFGWFCSGAIYLLLVLFV